MPGGYCTVFNCEPGSCPGESTCIGFRAQVSSVPNADGTDWVCGDTGGLSRFDRTFCMRQCSRDSDCRKGYACIDASERGNPYGAEVLDHRKGKVCAIAVEPRCGALAPNGAECPPEFTCVEGQCWPTRFVEASPDEPNLCTGTPITGSGGSGAGGAGTSPGGAGGGVGASGAGGRAGGGGAAGKGGADGSGAMSGAAGSLAAGRSGN
jgi:hypothetical protein